MNKVTIDNAETLVKYEMEIDDDTLQLALAFAECDDVRQAESVVGLVFSASVQAHYETNPDQDYPYTVGQFILGMLIGEDKVRQWDFYKDANEAAADGFYWFDGCGKWVQISVKH